MRPRSVLLPMAPPPPAPLSALEAAAEAPPAPEPVVVSAPAPTPTPTPAPAPAPSNDDVSYDPGNFDETPVSDYNPDDTDDDGVVDAWDGDSNTEHGQILSAGDGRLNVMTGRVSTLEHDGNGEVSAIEILDKPAFGNVTVNPDNTMALVMSTTQQTGQTNFSYKVTYADGTTETVNQSLNVTPGLQADGWAKGDHYMLEEDSDGNVVVEHGELHRKVYLSESNDALSRSDIAALEGVSVNQIDGEWLANNAEYGGDPSMALKTDIGMELWNEITGDGQVNSNWLLFERGYEYSKSDIGPLVERDTIGESELHPVYFGAWGEGDRPILNTKVEMFGGQFENIVFQGLHVDGGVLMLRGNDGVLFDDSSFTDRGFVVQWSDNVTIRNSELYDLQYETPKDGATNWNGEHVNRMQGVFVMDTEQLLIEGLFVDQAGWDDDYKFDLGGDGGQPPSIFSHNFYLQADNGDVTLRDTISSQASSFGAQIRSGGFVENVVVIDGNGGFTNHGGDYRGSGPVGEYTLYLNNLITDAGGRDTAGKNGAESIGFSNAGEITSFVDNIVAHLADPNDPSAAEDTRLTQNPLNNKKDAYYDDTIIYNWEAARDPGKYDDQNIDGLDTDELDATTIQNFAAAFMDQSEASVEDFAEYLISISKGDTNAAMAKATDILEYFGAAFGTYDAPDDTPTILRFVPDDRGDGFRWDNRSTGTRKKTRPMATALIWPETGSNMTAPSHWKTWISAMAASFMSAAVG